MYCCFKLPVVCASLPTEIFNVDNFLITTDIFPGASMVLVISFYSCTKILSFSSIGVVKGRTQIFMTGQRTLRKTFSGKTFVVSKHL